MSKPVLQSTQIADDQALLMISAELKRTRQQFPDINSLHEGYAIIKEELDEFWAFVKMKSSDRHAIQWETELIQIAAMAIRAYVDLGGLNANRQH